MSTKRFKLTRVAKILIFLIVLSGIGASVFLGLKTGIIKRESDKKVSSDSNATSDTDCNVINTDKKDDKTINLSLDEWIGWKPIIDCNGGLTTQPGSIYDKLGISVNISIINDATQSSNALISGKLDASGYTINRVAFLSDKFEKSDIDVIMPYITNFSNGGDGIIAKSNIKSVNDLVEAKIGVPQFSEAHSLVVWFVNQSDLSDKEKNSIIDNLIFFETPDEAAKAFFAGQVDVAATWEPYLTQAKNMSDSHILFSTASSTSLIMDGILFNKDFAEKNPDIVSTFIDGALQANDLYETDLSTIKSVMPMFSTASDEDITSNCKSAKLMTYADNIEMFSGTARKIYSDMCNVWKSVGESVNEKLLDSLYDDTYISALEDKYIDTKVTKTDTLSSVTEENKKELIDTEALLQKSATVNFLPDTAKFVDTSEASKSLDEFIDIAKVLNGTIIQIEGNISSDNDDEVGQKLSEQRANTIKQYFVMNGIDNNRIIVIGNGGKNPVAPNDTEENKAKNRRTDFYFKCVE